MDCDGAESQDVGFNQTIAAVDVRRGLDSYIGDNHEY